MSEGPPDPALLARAREGDRAALGELLTDETDRLYAVSLRMLGNPDDARDAAHDALVRIIRGLGEFDGRSAFTTWTTRIAMNVCLSRLRRARVRAAERRGTELEPDRLASTPQESARAAEHAGAKGVEVLEALAGLPDEQRAILVLRDIRGLEYEQIAAVLEIAIGTVKSRIFRARKALRERIEREREP